MPRNHVMLDLETLSTRSDAAIVQIAAVAFDPETGEIGSRFNVYVRDSGGPVDVQTVAWWMQRGEVAARLGAELAGKEAYPEGSALGMFCAWFLTLGCAVDAVWSHGATFDIPILESALARIERRAPWHYRAPRDTRTLYDVAPGGCPTVPADVSRKHDALYDCEVQVAQVCGALRALRVQAVEAATYRADYALANPERDAANMLSMSEGAPRNY